MIYLQMQGTKHNLGTYHVHYTAIPYIHWSFSRQIRNFDVIIPSYQILWITGSIPNVLSWMRTYFKSPYKCYAIRPLHIDFLTLMQSIPLNCIDLHIVVCQKSKLIPIQDKLIHVFGVRSAYILIRYIFVHLITNILYITSQVTI